MPPVHSTPLQIDPQWAQTLVSLPMSVPEHWWDGCKGNTLFKCRIVGVNCRDTSERYFVFECEDDDDDYSNDEGQRFPMRYDAVYHYADSDHANYSKFNLPVIPPAAPLPNETVRVRRKRKAEHPAWIQDLSVVHSAGTGQKIQTDTNGVVSKLNEQAEPNGRKGESYFPVQQRTSPWQIHQTVARNIPKHCAFECCPSIINSSANCKHSYRTTMRCKECSISEGRDVYLCNDVKTGIPILCHLAYHKSKHNKRYKHA